MHGSAAIEERNVNLFANEEPFEIAIRNSRFASQRRAVTNFNNLINNYARHFVSFLMRFVPIYGQQIYLIRRARKLRSGCARPNSKRNQFNR